MACAHAGTYWGRAKVQKDSTPDVMTQMLPGTAAHSKPASEGRLNGISVALKCCAVNGFWRWKNAGGAGGRAGRHVGFGGRGLCAEADQLHTVVAAVPYDLPRARLHTLPATAKFGSCCWLTFRALQAANDLATEHLHSLSAVLWHYC